MSSNTDVNMPTMKVSSSTNVNTLTMKVSSSTEVNMSTMEVSSSTDVNVTSQGGHRSGKSQGNVIFLQSQGKVWEFCKLVREILNNKKVGGKVREFYNFGSKYVL